MDIDLGKDMSLFDFVFTRLYVNVTMFTFMKTFILFMLNIVYRRTHISHAHWSR